MDPVSTTAAVVSAANDVKKSVVDPLMRVQKATSKTSLMRLTKDQIFNFPLFMDSDIDDDEKFPLIKSIEKNYASIVMMAITNEGVVDRERYESINQFLRKFHNNNDIPFSAAPGMESDITVTEAIASEGYVPEKTLLEMWDCVEEQLDTESINKMYRPYQRTVAKLTRALEAAHEVAMEAADSEMYFRRVSYKKDKDGNLVKDKGGNPIIEMGKDGNPAFQYILAPKDAAKHAELQAKYGEAKGVNGWNDTNIKQKIADAAKLHEDDRKREDEKEAKRIAREDDKEAKRIAREDEKEAAARSREQERDRLTARSKVRGDMVNDTKFNILTPTVLKMTIANAKSATSWNQELIIGVRAMPRLMPQSLLIANMVEAFKDRAIFKFIKWTKGEIKWADLFLGIDAARTAAKVKAESRWLKVLRKRSKKANSRWLGYKLNPNTAIIITEADAHIIQEKCGVDPHHVNAVLKMMSKYFLLGFGIYDTEGKVLSIIYDGEDEFTQHSMRSMIADSKKESNLLAMGRY